MKSRWRENREAAKTYNTSPTLTDQSAARETDINIIVKRFTQTGMVPAAKTAPMSGDFTEFPGSLREFIEQARSGGSLKNGLPEKLRNMSVQELLALNAKQLTDILAPEPDKKPDDKVEK